MTVLAYCRVSTTGQSTENQRQEILAQGFKVDEWYQEEGVSGSVPARHRPEFAKMMVAARKGDTCLVTFVDRLGRDAEDILNTINTFKRMGVKLRVTKLDAIDVTSSTGKMVVTMLSGLAEMERAILQERTVMGIARVQKEGVRWGAPLKVSPAVYGNIITDRNSGMSLERLGTKYSLHRNTLQKIVSKWGSDLDGYTTEFEAKAMQHASEKSVARRLLRAAAG